MSKISGIFASAAAAALSLALCWARLRYAGRYRRACHENQHQSLLCQDEGRLRGQGQGARPDAASLRRQVRRRQRRRGRGDRAADRRRRQGHPARAERFDRDRADRRRRRATPASSSSRSTRRSIPITAADANFATDNFKAGRADRPMGEGDPRRQGQDGQDRHARPHRQPADGRLSAPQRLPHRLWHSGQGSQALRR